MSHNLINAAAGLRDLLRAAFPDTMLRAVGLAICADQPGLDDPLAHAVVSEPDEAKGRP